MAGEADKPKVPQSPWPPWSATSKPAAIVDEATDLKSLRTAVVDAAGVGAGLWFSYLFVLLYLLIVVGSVTHRDLFLENPVKLPFLNVELPLVGFFVLGPLLFVIVHAYVLLHFVLLSDKVGAFHSQLEAQIPDAAVRYDANCLAIFSCRRSLVHARCAEASLESDVAPYCPDQRDRGSVSLARVLPDSVFALPSSLGNRVVAAHDRRYRSCFTVDTVAFDLAW
jgi:hypothetical protein